jgi:hypothetical protein
MIEIKTNKHTLVFVEVPENCTEYHYKEKESMPLCLMVGYFVTGFPMFSPRILPDCENGYIILGEVTKDAATFDFDKYLPEKVNGSYVYPTTGLALMQSQGIELTEGNKFIVLEAKYHES